jgi:site-specific recombinase XerD
MNITTQLNNFLRYLTLHGLSQKSLKYYKSDISHFLYWADGRDVSKVLIQEYINSQRMTTPASTLNRRLSTLRSYSNFIGKDLMNGIENFKNE